MLNKYGVFLNGYLVSKYDTPLEAYESALLAYNETGTFHEVKLCYC